MKFRDIKNVPQMESQDEGAHQLVQSVMELFKQYAFEMLNEHPKALNNEQLLLKMLELVNATSSQLKEVGGMRFLEVWRYHQEKKKDSLINQVVRINK